MDVRIECVLVKPEMDDYGPIAMYGARMGVVTKLSGDAGIDRIGVFTQTGGLKLVGSCMIFVDKLAKIFYQSTRLYIPFVLLVWCLKSNLN